MQYLLYSTYYTVLILQYLFYSTYFKVLILQYLLYSTWVLIFWIFYENKKPYNCKELKEKKNNNKICKKIWQITKIKAVKD